MADASLGEARRDRLLFLDVLRAVAALSVVMEHGIQACVPAYLDISIRYFDLGQFGVTLFLLVSGFIIPVTLERGQSNRRFWINRFFRLFPLYWATIAFFGLYYRWFRPEAVYPAELWQWLANLTMVQEFLRAPHVSSVFWTLTLELTFYASCSVLYALGLFRRTSALVWIGQGALLLAGVAVPLLVGRRFPGGYGFLFFTMFVGSLFYRLTAGQVTRRELAWVLASLGIVALSVSYVSFACFTRDGYPLTFHNVFTVWLCAYACFMLTLAWRSAPMPAWICYLGRISYSIYLVHACLILVLPTSWPALVYLPALVGGTLALAAFTYHAIERPGILLGRRVAEAMCGTGPLPAPPVRAATYADERPLPRDAA